MGTKGTWRRESQISREQEERNWRLITNNATPEDLEWLEKQKQKDEKED